MKFTKECIKILKKMAKIIEVILITIIIFISLIIIIQRFSNNEKSFLGYRIFRVETGSMVPKYLVGDVILVKDQKFEQLKIGDDLTYNGLSGNVAGKIITHQIIDIEIVNGKKIIHTKGIANSQEDPEIFEEQIIGKVITKMNILTVITKCLNNKYIFYFLGIVPLTIYIFFSVIRYNNRVEERVKERNKKFDEK